VNKDEGKRLSETLRGKEHHHEFSRIIRITLIIINIFWWLVIRVR